MIKKLKAMLPEGTIPVGIGLLTLGLCIYLFQAFATRSFGKSHYAAFGAMWLLTFVVVPGVFLPVEQELGRALSARAARGEGGGPLIRKAATLAFGLLVATIVVTLLAAHAINTVLFKNHSSLLACLIFALVGYAFAFTVRGVLAGNQRFSSYGLLLGLEGGVRTVLAIGLLITHNQNYLAWGILVGLSPLVAAVAALSRERNLGGAGPEAKYSEISQSLGWLLLGSLVAQSLLNAAPLVVQGSAKTQAQHDLSSVFTSSIFIARIPLFMFQAVQAALLPKLARLAAKNETTAFRRGLERLLVLVAIIGAVSVIGLYVLGPTIVQKMTKIDIPMPRKDLGMLALGNAIFMLALASAQALIALSALKRAAFAWVLGAIAFVVTVVVVHGFFFRAEMALLIGSIVSTIAMLGFVRNELHKVGADPHLADLIDASVPYHELIEP